MIQTDERKSLFKPRSLFHVLRAWCASSQCDQIRVFFFQLVSVDTSFYYLLFLLFITITVNAPASPFSASLLAVTVNWLVTGHRDSTPSEAPSPRALEGPACRLPRILVSKENRKRDTVRKDNGATASRPASPPRTRTRTALPPSHGEGAPGSCPTLGKKLGLRWAEGRHDTRLRLPVTSFCLRTEPTEPLTNRLQRKAQNYNRAAGSSGLKRQVSSL